MIQLQAPFKTALNKTILFVVLLTLFSSQVVFAESKLYRSNSKMPFIKMMLSMMSAMGILDKASGFGGPGFDGQGFGGPGFGSFGQYGNSMPPWNNYANNPFQRSPWMQSPWSQSTLGGVSPVWGSPDWGLLPTHEYSYGYSPYGYGYTPYGTRWSSSDLDGWVKEPWEVSEWNPDANMPARAPVQQQAQQQSIQQQAVQPVTPIVQNFNYNLREDVHHNKEQHTDIQNSGRRQHNDQYQQSPLAKLHQQQFTDRSPGWLTDSRQLARSPVNQSRQPVPRQKTKKQLRQEKPCITDFCGLKKPNLDGLWVSKDGEMLGVKNKRYLWSDGESRYLTGQLKIQNEYLLASVEGSEKLMRFKYKLAGNNLLTMQPDGTIREFMRKPMNSYAGRYQGSY